VVSEVWARVADDYAGQDVDVTTEEPSPDEITRDSQADTDYGTRLLIDPTTDYQGQCGCGGVAYVGVFDDASNHAYYQPALAFTEGVGTGAKNLAEVASHEVGHNLGLNHDGTSETGYYPGHGDWAPIMGVGYDRPITQWSSGEYADANNTEDDLAVMADHGAALMVDDHGNDPASATPLALGAATTGIVADRTDVDVFSVDVADGTLSITADPAAVEPDLDIKLELLDSAGQVVATADPPSNEAGGMSASLSESVTAGTYLVRVDGTGFGDPLDTGYSDYASLGGFTVVATQ
jgi:Bacterial pre-peptidase C-terminal domain/Metallo-peptidase family M12B Reprolysin-like